MQKLLAFLMSKRHWILFVLCELISFVLIYRNNAYQRNMMLTSANVIAGSISSLSGAVFSYLDLQKVNQELLEHNGILEMEVLRLREQLKELSLDTVNFNPAFPEDTVFALKSAYEFITVRAINNSTTYLNNYITLNKGSADGLRPDMGVVSPHGVVGIVMTVREHYSVVISLLNTKLNISCKVKGTDFSGPLSWKGGDVAYAYLEELPTHAVFEVGDTIVTSGNSAIFPPGIMAGTVDSYSKQRDDNFYSLKVRLATDFYSLSVLCAIRNDAQEEQWKIEQEVMEE
ncbi:MAG: rod shape-determining protein MreC [Tannerella sp.]|jgi:rod shape-determining protein MreC|nr:rod shape-determining protein MreC [Tannerella sp.]